MPGLFDLPLAELSRYAGTNPCPTDHDAYWSEALAQMKGTNPDLELKENRSLSSKAVECFDLWFTGVNGARVHAKYLRPRNQRGKTPAVIEFHGYAWSSGDWCGKIAWVAEGFSVLSMDCRGQAGLSQDSGAPAGSTLRGHIIRGLEDPDPRRLYYRQVFLDAAQLAGIAMDQLEIDPMRVGTCGGSQGGGLSLACAALETRVKRAVAVFPFLCDYQRVWQMDQAKDAYEELKLFFRWRDPRHERSVEIFTKLGYIDVQFLAPRIKAEVLMFTALGDTVCPPSTQYAAYNKIHSSKKMVHYPDFGHENLPGQTDISFNFLMGL